MYKLYFWNPWNFGQWIYKGEFATREALNAQIKNKRQTTYKVTKDNDVIEYHKAASECWRYGMVKPQQLEAKTV